MDQQNLTLAKIPILDTGKFEQWKFQIQQYLQHEHYALWEVIKFGDSYETPTNVATTGTTSDETGKKKGRTVTVTADDMQKRKNDVKARTTLLLSLLNEHQLRFSKYKTAQELWATILKTFGGNEATKKTKKNLLKQQYGNFKAEGSETLEQTFNRLQAPKVLMAIDGAGWDWSYIANDEENHALVADEQAPTKFALMDKTSAESEVFDSSLCSKDCNKNTDSLNSFQTSSKDLDSLLESQRLDKNMEGLGYSAVPPHPAQIYSPPKKDINPSVTETEASPSTISPKSFIKFVKANNSPTKSRINKVETAKKPPVRYVEQYIKPTKKPNVRGNQRNWNNLKSHQLGPNFVRKKNAFFNCGDFNYLAYDCSKRVKKGTSRSQNNTHKSFIPRHAVHKPHRPPMRPMRSNMNAARPNRTSFNKPAHSYTKRPFQRTSALRSQFRAPWVPTINRNFPYVNRKFPTANKKFSTSSTKISAADMGKKENAVKASAVVPRITLMTKAIGTLAALGTWQATYPTSLIMSHLMKDMCLLVKDDARLLAKELSKPLNLKCIVLGRNFKLSDDDNVLLRTPRQHNMYPIDLNNIVPHKDLTYLVTKASADECMICHRRLGKFEAKGDEGYFIEYSMSSKAFRVFNKRTKRVEENLHVEFLENKAIKKGAGPNWLFDIDSLNKSMNYVPVDAGTNSTNFSGTKVVASQEVKKDVSFLRYIALPNWVYDALLESSSCKPQDDCNTDAPEGSGNSNPTATSTNPPAEQLETLTVETPIPTVSSPVPTACLNNSPESSNGVEADVSNMETTITASPTPTLRIHKDHPKSQIIGPVDTPIQTRNKSKEYMGDILKKFGYSDVRSSNTPTDKENPWGKDRTGKDVDLYLYRSMMGSLIYLTASRPYIMFAVCACARHQVTPKECHLHAVKRIFRYLKGHPKLGLWYPKDSPFDLVAYSDSDYGGATQDRKSTTEG
nr:hypothetical protein [Tanacetum cinerariifolium]